MGRGYAYATITNDLEIANRKRFLRYTFLRYT